MTTPIRKIVIGENHRSVAVLNRPVEDILSGSGYSSGGEDFAGFSTVAALAAEATARGAGDTAVLASMLQYPILGGETGVSDVRYPYNDLRRFGVDATGVTSSLDAARNAIASIGVNGTVLFPKNATLLLDGSLAPLAGQTWDLRGCVLKRCAQITDTTATAITTSGVQTITVANPNRWRVGMEITVFNGGTIEFTNHRITNKVGAALTLQAFFTTAFPSGGTVVSSFELVSCIVVPGVTIIGGEYDGNRSGNTALQTWQNHSSVHFVSDRGRLDRLYIHDSQSDGIQCGGTGLKLGALDVIDSQGNGVHFTDAIEWMADTIRVKNCNLSGTATGHADGCFIFSNNTGKGLVENLIAINGIAAIGSIDSDDNSEVSFNNVYAENCTSFFLDMVVPDTQAGKVTITNFHAVNCGTLSLNETQNLSHFPATAGAYRVQLAHGQLTNTPVGLTRASGIMLDDVLIDLTGDITSIGVQINQCNDVVLTESCRIIGGLTGVQVTGVCQNVRINGTFRDQFSIALSLQNVSATSRNVAVRGARISNSSATVTGVSTASSASYKAITLANGTLATGCDIDLQIGSWGIEFPNGAANVTGGMAMGNKIVTTGVIPCAKIFGGAINNYFRDNWYSVAIANGQPANNIVEGNMPLGATAALV